MGKLGFDNDTEFTLDSVELDSLVVEEPLNWDEDDKSYEYDKLGGGTLMKVNTNLEFIGDGYKFIRTHPLVYGFGSKINVTKRIKDPTKIGEDQRIGYTSVLDLTKAEFDHSKTKPIVRVPFTQGGLFDKIKARYNDKYDLVSTEDADGNDIGELSTITEQVNGREIFRRSVGAVEDGTRVQHTVTGGDKDNASGVLLAIKPNSDREYIKDINFGSHYVPYNDDEYANGSLGSLLFTRSDRYRKRVLNGKIKVKIVDSDIGFLRLEKVFYGFNSTNNKYEYIDGSRKTLLQIDASNLNSFLEYDFVDHEIELEADQAFALVLYSRTEDGMGYEYYDTEVIITEDDNFPATTALGLLPHELFDRLLAKITGESGLLVSNVFGRKELGYKTEGQWSLLGVSSGYWSRGFDLGEPIKDPETGELIPKKQFSISLKEAFEAFYVPEPLSWGVEKVKGKEVFRLEKYEYTQQDFVGIQMGREINGVFTHIQATKPIETVLGKNLFTGIKIGYDEGGKDYEEVSGLTSPHGTAEFNTYLDTEPNIYTKTSKIRADLEGFDLARRKQSISYADEDTSYDQKLFFRHLKRVGNQYFLRTWEDDFSEKPKGGIYSPDTTGNLLITPFYCLKRHGRIIATGISRQPFKKVKWISSNCYSDLITKSIGGEEVLEKGFILNKDLGMPYINGFLLKFEGKVYQSMIDQFEGRTFINGESTPNWCGRFEVMVNGVLKYGRLIKSNITKEGKHEIALI